MAKLSEKYETMMVFSLKDGEEQVESLKQKFTALIEGGAELISVNEWGKRRLAYPINYENDGYYVLFGFDCKPDFPMELERVLNITEGILRFLTVLRVDSPVKLPADDSAAEPPEKGEVDITHVDDENQATDSDKDDEETDDNSEEEDVSAPETETEEEDS